MTFTLPLRSPPGFPLQASKWQKIPMLIDPVEMRSLFTALGSFWIVQTSGVIRAGDEVILLNDFFELYEQYIASIKKGENLITSKMRSYFSSVLTIFSEALYAIEINQNQRLVKVHQPVVQMQMHRFDYSFADHSFRSMGMGGSSIPWGIQFS